jgi:choline dehydrogenase-like flavoprotein
MSLISLVLNMISSSLEVWSRRLAANADEQWKPAGAAGNVVANRLTENPNFSVLVLEAGVSSVLANPYLMMTAIDLMQEWRDHRLLCPILSGEFTFWTGRLRMELHHDAPGWPE